jgi:AcrR family transcriptional regulator
VIENLNHMTKTTQRAPRRPARPAPRRRSAPRVPPSQETQDRILDAAEQLFAERGIDAVSVRSVLAAAGVNVSLAHYHFGGRDGLIEALLRHRFGAITEERLRRLAEVDARGKDASIEDILRAYHEYPPPEWFEQRPDFYRLLGHLQFSPNPRIVEIVKNALRDAYVPLGEAIAKRLPPGLSPGRWTARFYFVMGIGAFAAMMFGDMARSACKHYGPGASLDGRTVIDEIVRFCAAGLRASAGEEKT